MDEHDYKPNVAAMLATDFSTAADNSHALYLEERRLAVQTAAAGLAVDSALQGFYRDRMAYVIDAGTARLRMDWRGDRDKLRQDGENLENAVGYRAFEDSPHDALQSLAREWLATAVDFANWQSRSAELLAEEWDGGTLAEAAAVLRELRALQDSTDADPVAGEVAAPVLAERCQLETGDLAGRLEILRRLGLCGTRYVGGTSGTLIHACERPPVAAYVPDAVTLAKPDYFN